MNKRIKVITLISCIILFLILGLYIIKTNDNVIDKSIYNLIISIKSDIFTKLFIFISRLASTKFLIIISIIILFLKKLKNKRYIIIYNLIFSVILNNILKLIFRRIRPLDIMLIEIKGYSFPSGHTMAASIFYGTIIYLIYKSKINKNIKIILISLLTILVLLIGISRIYLGVHYASDVIGGYLVSISYLIISIYFLNKKEDLC